MDRPEIVAPERLSVPPILKLVMFAVSIFAVVIVVLEMVVVAKFVVPVTAKLVEVILSANRLEIYALIAVK